MVPEAVAGWRDGIQYLKVLRIGCSILISTEDECNPEYLKGDADGAHERDGEDTVSKEAGKQGEDDKPEPLDLSITFQLIWVDAHTTAQWKTRGSTSDEEDRNQSCTDIHEYVNDAPAG